jgi:hypothetical protein
MSQKPLLLVGGILGAVLGSLLFTAIVAAVPFKSGVAPLTVLTFGIIGSGVLGIGVGALLRARGSVQAPKQTLRELRTRQA